MKVLEIDRDDSFESFVSKKEVNNQSKPDVVSSTVVRKSIKTIATYP